LQKPLVVNGVVVDPFEEEEEGTGVASDVVKVDGEDPAIQVPCLEERPRDRNDCPILVNKTKPQ